MKELDDDDDDDGDNNDDEHDDFESAFYQIKHFI